MDARKLILQFRSFFRIFESGVEHPGRSLDLGKPVLTVQDLSVIILMSERTLKDLLYRISASARNDKVRKDRNVLDGRQGLRTHSSLV